MSWDEAFAERYAEWASGMTEDVPCYVSLALDADGPVVELAVGSARVAAPVTRALGRTVIGIDSSPAMLEQARSTGADLDLRLGDILGLELEALYGGFEREPFTDESREYVFVTRRPPELHSG